MDITSKGSQCMIVSQCVCDWVEPRRAAAHYWGGFVGGCRGEGGFSFLTEPGQLVDATPCKVLKQRVPTGEATTPAGCNPEARMTSAMTKSCNSKLKRKQQHEADGMEEDTTEMQPTSIAAHFGDMSPSLGKSLKQHLGREMLELPFSRSPSFVPVFRMRCFLQDDANGTGSAWVGK